MITLVRQEIYQTKKCIKVLMEIEQVTCKEKGWKFEMESGNVMALGAVYTLGKDGCKVQCLRNVSCFCSRERGLSWKPITGKRFPLGSLKLDYPFGHMSITLKLHPGLKAREACSSNPNLPWSIPGVCPPNDQDHSTPPTPKPISLNFHSLRSLKVVPICLLWWPMHLLQDVFYKAAAPSTLSHTQVGTG